MINMNPGIDWTKEDLELVTRSGVRHFDKTKDKLSKHSITAYQCWGLGGYSIVNRGSYLSVQVYTPDDPRDLYRVCDFQKAVKEGRAHLKHYCGYTWAMLREIIFETQRELRIYKDRSFVLVRRVNFKDGDTLTYVYDGPFSTYADTWGSTRNAAASKENINKKGFVEVHSDKEIAAHSMSMTNKTITQLLYWCRKWFNDLDGRYMDCVNASSISKFTPKTQKLVEEFFEFEKPVSARIASKLHKKNNTKHICNMRDLLTLCTFSTTVTAAAKTKEERAEAIVQVVSDIWNNPTDHENEAVWFRHKNSICMVLPNTDSAKSGWGAGCKKLFAYDVKTKRRFYAEQDDRGVWAFPVPSASYIAVACYLGRGKMCSYNAKRHPLVKTTILGGLTVNELFAGSNVSWILSNPHEECEVLDIDGLEDVNLRVGVITDVEVKKRSVSIDKCLRNDYIGSIPLAILATSGVLVLEQLLKANLFNMYFTILEDMMYGNDDKNILDLDKNKEHPYWHEAGLRYHGKEKNLKKMFGMPIQLLRLIDEKCGFDTDVISRWGGSGFRTCPKLIGAEVTLGVSLGALDTESFKRCLAIGKKRERHNGSYVVNVWERVGNRVLKASEGAYNPKQIIACLEELTEDGGQNLRDYLVMREQLQEISKKVPKAAGVWSEKFYPLKPGPAHRFIQYIEGMRDMKYTWRTEPITSETFLDQMVEKYRGAHDSGRMTVVREGDKVRGVSIDMTPYENMQFLHDEASYWVTFYQDEAKDALFKDAVKRVQPLQWRNDAQGLMIVAPKSVEDIKNEGMMLHHCVASYIDPIIKGVENIMFLRRTDMPSIPYYTVEILNGEIRQVHCYSNGDLTERGQVSAGERSGLESYNKTFDIVKFLTSWATAMKGKINAKSVKQCYGALCAVQQ